MDVAQFIEEMHKHYYRAGVYHTMKDPDQDYTSGNHAVLNATYYAILNQNNATTEADRVTAQAFIESCRGPNDTFNRTPTKPDLQGQDDLIGIAVTAKALGLPYAYELHLRGKRWMYPKLFGIPIPFRYYYNNETRTDLNIKSYYGNLRFPWFTAFITESAGEEPSLFQEIAYVVMLYGDIRNKNTGDTSGRILTWLMNQNMKGKSKFVDYFIRKWEISISELYPDKIGGVFSVYHGPSHPFSVFMKGKI